MKMLFGSKKMEATLINHMGNDLSVVNAARVSFGKVSHLVYLPSSDDWVLSERDKKLINYLAKHNHKSPFNHTYLTFHVRAPIFVARQLVKHKFMPWNEISRRYVDYEPEFYWPDEWRGKSKDKKQGSDGIVELKHDFKTYLLHHLKGCVTYYSKLIEANVSPEMARMVLPQNTYTEWYWSGTLGAFADMYNLRSKEDTQWETRQITLEIGEQIEPLFPVSWKALTNG